MINMDEYEYIRTAHRVYGKGVREIARGTGHDWKTIRKVLRGERSAYGQRQSQPYPGSARIQIRSIRGWKGTRMLHESSVTLRQGSIIAWSTKKVLQVVRQRFASTCGKPR